VYLVAIMCAPASEQTSILHIIKNCELQSQLGDYTTRPNNPNNLKNMLRSKQNERHHPGSQRSGR
jgi:hypothetical protein